MTDDRTPGDDPQPGPEGQNEDDRGLNRDERAELEHLRQEVAQLKAHTAPETPPERPHHSLRTTVAYGLVVLASLLLIVTVVARYVRAEVLDTDHYVATVEPLAKDPNVQRTVAERVTTTLFDELGVENTVETVLGDLIDDGAPELLSGLAVPITQQAESFVEDTVREMLATDQFAELWTEANRVAHDQLDKVLTGEDEGAIDVDDGRISLDIGSLVQAVKQELVDRNFGLADNIPDDVDLKIPLFESDELARAQTATRWLDGLATVLPFVCLALLAVAVLLAPDRRKMLITAAIGAALGMVVLGLALAIARAWFQNHGASDELPADTALAIARTLLAPLRTSLRMVLAFSVVFAAGVFLTGPSDAAQKVRATVKNAAGALQERAAGDRPPSGVELWIGAHKNPLRAAVVILGIVALVQWRYPSATVVAVLTLLVLVGLLVIEVLGRRPASQAGTP